MTDPWAARIRIGHAERDKAVETLRDAAAEGRLTLTELDERIEVAMAAKTREDLRSLLADLVAPVQLDQTINPGATVARIAEPGWSWQDPLVFTATWEDVVRAGPWEVPPFLELNPVAANVKLNFVDARTTGEIIDVQLHGGAGDAVLVVPEGWGVDVSRIEKGMGSIKSTVDPRPAGRYPLIVVRGNTSMGSVKVRLPNWFDTMLRDRRLAKGGGIVSKN